MILISKSEGVDSEVYADEHNIYKAYLSLSEKRLRSYHSLQNKVADKTIEILVMGIFDDNRFNTIQVNTLQLKNDFITHLEANSLGIEIADKSLIVKQKRIHGIGLIQTDWVKGQGEIEMHCGDFMQTIAGEYAKHIIYHPNDLNSMNIIVQGVKDRVLQCVVTDIGGEIEILLAKNC